MGKLILGMLLLGALFSSASEKVECYKLATKSKRPKMSKSMALRLCQKSSDSVLSIQCMQKFWSLEDYDMSTFESIELCSSSPDPSEVVDCYKKARDYVKGLNLVHTQAVELCKGATKAQAIFDCFKNARHPRGLNFGIDRAIKLCAISLYSYMGSECFKSARAHKEIKLDVDETIALCRN